MDWVRLILDFVVEFKWPGLVVFILLRFRNLMPSLVDRLRSFELPGGVKGTLAEPLATLDRAAVELAADVAEIPIEAGPPTSVPETGTTTALPKSAARTVDVRSSVSAGATATARATVISPAADETYAIERRVLDAARASPEVALMLLATEIEKALRQVIGSRGDLDGGSRLPATARFLLQSLIERDDLPRSLAASMDAFWSVRNLVVHGRDSSREEILQAIDSGLTILRSLKAIPQVVYSVREPRLDLFSDAAGEQPRKDVWGVVLDITSPGGVATGVEVVPTRKVYRKGKRVSIEWTGPPLGETWYRNPANGQIEYGWRSILEFVGRHIDEIR